MIAEDRLNPLLAERAPWLFAPDLPCRFARQVLDKLLSGERSRAICQAFQDQPATHVMDTAARLIARRVEVQGLHHIPSAGPALIVANHPTGIADGLVLHRLLSRRRSDVFFFANSDIFRILPQLATHIIPVEWRYEKRSHTKAKTTMALTRTAIEARRLGVIFPSGRLAKRHGLRLVERPWMASAAMIARKFDLPVIPIHIRARNSALFYAFDALHPTLRDITLFHETLNKTRHPFSVTIGAPMHAKHLARDSDTAIAQLRQATLRLGEADHQGQSLLIPGRKPARGALFPGWA